MKFVWLENEYGTAMPINPDQVRYLEPGPKDPPALTQVVFAAFAGGFHKLLVKGAMADVAALLEYNGRIIEPPPPPPQLAEKPKRGGSKTPAR